MGAAKWTSGEMNLLDLFPNLTAFNHEITSEKTIKYNCIAWVARSTDRWWQPGIHWPIMSSREDIGIGDLVVAFRSLGYEALECSDYGKVVQFMKRPFRPERQPQASEVG